jgi:hypothetical protein
MHKHRFRLHVGVRVFGGTGIAWLEWHPARQPEEYSLEMWRCIDCGEQGYMIPAPSAA